MARPSHRTPRSIGTPRSGSPNNAHIETLPPSPKHPARPAREWVLPVMDRLAAAAVVREEDSYREEYEEEAERTVGAPFQGYPGPARYGRYGGGGFGGHGSK